LAPCFGPGGVLAEPDVGLPPVGLPLRAHGGPNGVLAGAPPRPQPGRPTVAGAVVVGGGAAGELAGMPAARGLPLIRISNARHDDGIPRIYLDATGGIDTAVAHLVHLGHRRIGLAVLRDSAAPARIAGFRRSM